jgi:polyisoprenoid-binding protein YceI
VSGDKATGEMTIRGITAEETVEGITVTEENGVTTVAGKLTFDRKKYGVSWDPAAEVVLSDNVPLNISLVLSKS